MNKDLHATLQSIPNYTFAIGGMPWSRSGIGEYMRSESHRPVEFASDKIQRQIQQINERYNFQHGSKARKNKSRRKRK